MKIIFHPDFLRHYAFDPAAEQGRLDPALSLLGDKYPFSEPRPAKKEEILRVHTERHWLSIADDKLLYHTASLAAGASLEAAEESMEGAHAFALCRPPGHHASADSCWGFCYFNNIAIAVKHLLDQGQIGSALIVDFDLHFGDGTANIFQGEKAVTFWHCREGSSRRYLDMLEKDLHDFDADLLAVSAGFDRGVDDWGGMLTANDYYKIGSLLANFAREKCGNRIFSVLEGGYKPHALAKNIDSYLQGLQKLSMEK